MVGGRRQGPALESLVVQGQHYLGDHPLAVRPMGAATQGTRSWANVGSHGHPGGMPRRIRIAGTAGTGGMAPRQLDELLYRLYGMYLVVLAARLAYTSLGKQGHGEALFLRHPAPGGAGGYPW